VARAEAYLLAKFHLEPSNRLATIHQRCRQDRTDRQTDNGPIAYRRTVLETVAQKGIPTNGPFVYGELVVLGTGTFALSFLGYSQNYEIL